MNLRAHMQHELNISTSDELAGFLKLEASRRGVSQEAVGRFALELFMHYSAQIAEARAVLLYAPGVDEPSTDVVYSTTVPVSTSVELRTAPESENPLTYLLSVSPSRVPHLRLVE